jgi:Cu+-exporting ATPase
LIAFSLAIDFIDANIAFNVFTAVLIVACPCALALTAPPFTLECIANIRKTEILSQNALVIEQLAKVDTIVFDKTGTITTNKKNRKFLMKETFFPMRINCW